VSQPPDADEYHENNLRLREAGSPSGRTAAMKKFGFSLFKRGLAWKANVELSLSDLTKQLDESRKDLLQARTELALIKKQEQDRFAVEKAQANIFHREVIDPLTNQFGEISALENLYEVLILRRNSELLVMLIAANDPMRAQFGAADIANVLAAVWDRTLDKAFFIVEGRAGNVVTHRADELLDAVRQMPAEAFAWAETRKLRSIDTIENKCEDYFARLERIRSDPDRLDFHAQREGARNAGGKISNSPFDEPGFLPSFVPAEAKRRSVVLLHNSYYHFNCLSAGLRKRGWDAVTVSCEATDSSQRQFYHGEDINLHDADPAVMHRKIADFFRTVPERYSALHFCGQGHASFFSENVENDPNPRLIPWDFLELRRHRVVIGYMPSGCLDGGMQSSIRELTGGLCGRCIWELRPDVCSDARSLAWNKKLALLCDWVGLECDLATPERISAKTVYGPVVTALDPDRWRPDIKVPSDMDIGRSSGEVIVYHAVGNYDARRGAGRDIKGTGSLMNAIETLKAEGLPVRLVFAHDIPSTMVRFLQVQADIVVDQLNYGRYGANAREALMLGKPTICRLSPLQSRPLAPLRPVQEAPIVDASEETITDILRALVLDPDRRAALSRRARAFALAWHGQDACAERYERLIDRIHLNLAPESSDLYPPEVAAKAWLT
jgi:hypothetical protein